MEIIDAFRVKTAPYFVMRLRASLQKSTIFVKQTMLYA